jgi:hypothetical protein
MKISDLIYNKVHNQLGILINSPDNIYFTYCWFHDNVEYTVHYMHIMEYWREAQKLKHGNQSR